jgi:fructoselysine-6-P-deglycase FrlB-like protein
LVVGISASGGSSETLGFVAGHPGFVALTNVADSAITATATHVVPMLAEAEPGGVACRSFQHTLVALLALEEQLTGTDLGLAGRVRRCADATEALLSDRRWLDDVAAALDGPHGVYAIAPSDRISSALQAALMVREGPRRPADGCETGDWSHVDVYLTKTLSYRALLFPGSRHDAAARDWLTQRGATVVTVGAGVSSDAVQVRYPGDDDAIVALLTEVLIPELLAARWWMSPA